MIRATHSNVRCCRRGALKSATLQEGVLKSAALREGRAGFRGLALSWLCVRVPRCCTRLGFFIGSASEGAPLGDRRIRRALRHPGCAQGRMKALHSVQGEGTKGSTLRVHFEGRVQASCYLLWSCARLQRRSSRGAVHCCIRCNQVGHCAKKCFNPRLVWAADNEAG